MIGKRHPGVDVPAMMTHSKTNGVPKQHAKQRGVHLPCQARAAVPCKEAAAEARYRCGQCGTLQCKACDKLLHGKNHVSHERCELVASEVPCQADKCRTHVRATSFCESCALCLCGQCDLAGHQGDKRDHVRIALQKSNKNSEFHQEPFESVFSMTSMDNDESLLSDRSCSHLSDVPVEMVGKQGVAHGVGRRSFHLVNEKEVLQVTNLADFLQKLGCSESSLVKVVSIFGNTGEGKSHTLNHAFFEGEEVFRTSASQDAGTVGVWAAYDPTLDVVLIDTEGLLGVSANQNQRTRLLLKVLAISDLIIYRTRAERLHNDLFQFLGDASKAYKDHFRKELKAAFERCGFKGSLSQLGPAVVIFHETQHTEILKGEKQRDRIALLKQRFDDLGFRYDAFSDLEYVGIQTVSSSTNFNTLVKAVKKQLNNLRVRSARQPAVVYQALQVLNDKFNGSIEKTVTGTFPDQYFTCSGKCLSCGVRCQSTMNHQQDKTPHTASAKCRYQHQFDNRLFTCKACHEQGKTVVVLPKTASSTDSSWIGLAKYAWSGYVLECEACGIIYRSRQYWYGNRDPVETVVRTEITHVWPGSNPSLHTTQNAARKVLDGVGYISSTVSSIGAGPTKVLSSWMADRIAPAYWRPNAEITICHHCGIKFEPTDRFHHCRACGEGFCELCSNYFRPVPEKGWGETKVRVCKSCRDSSKNEEESSPEDIRPRRVGELLQSTIGSVVSAIDYPLEFVSGVIKDSVRPTYWVPDENILQCHLCQIEFNAKVARHHCRACGEGVCDGCSPCNKPVPLRGWDQPVRVCNQCIAKGEL